MPRNDFTAFADDLGVATRANSPFTGKGGGDGFPFETNRCPHEYDYPQWENVTWLGVLCDAYEACENREQRLGKLEEIRDVLKEIDAYLSKTQQ